MKLQRAPAPARQQHRINRFLPLARLIAGLSAQQLTFRPADEKWSIVEILAHLGEDELATSWRYRQMIEHDGCSLSGFDQDLWARLGTYAV
jgi:DinB superfamily